MKSFVSGLVGFILGIVFLAGSVFLCLKFLPINAATGIFGVNTDEYVSEDVSGKSVIDSLKGLNEYDLDDVTVLKDAIIELANNEGIKDYVTVDEEKLGKLKLADISTGIGDCLTIKTLDSVYLVDIMPVSGNEKIYDILREGTGAESNELIKASDLDGLDIKRIRLKTILSESDVSTSAILAALYKDDTVTVGNLSEKLNNVKLSQIYNTVDCFTSDVGRATDIAKKYSYSGATRTYTLDPEGRYYIDSGVKAWFFIFYNPGEINADGDALTYTPTDYTVQDMQAVVDGINEKITNATVKQLIDTGVLTGTYSSAIYGKTLKTVLQGVV